jgi:hypothetical protein
VLNYSQSKQLDLLRNLGFDSPSWADLGYVLIGVVVFASLVGAAWTLWERHRQDPWLRLLHRATQRVQRAGHDRCQPHAPPRQLARLLWQAYRTGAPVRRWTDVAAKAAIVPVAAATGGLALRPPQPARWQPGPATPRTGYTAAPVPAIALAAARPLKPCCG